MINRGDPNKPTLPLVKHNWASRNIVGLVFLGITLTIFGFATVSAIHAQNQYIEVFGSTQNPTCENIVENYHKLTHKILQSMIEKWYIDNCTDLKQMEESVIESLEKP